MLILVMRITTTQSTPLNPPGPLFNGFGNLRSMLQGSTNQARVYDTWSTHYENVGLPGLISRPISCELSPAGAPTVSTMTERNGIVDDENEKITSPPYPCRLGHTGQNPHIRAGQPADSRIDHGPRFPAQIMVNSFIKARPSVTPNNLLLEQHFSLPLCGISKPCLLE